MIFNALSIVIAEGGAAPIEYVYDRASQFVAPGMAYRYYMKTMDNARAYKQRVAGYRDGTRKLVPEGERVQRGRRQKAQDSIRGAIHKGYFTRKVVEGTTYLVITEHGIHRARVSGIPVPTEFA